MVTQGLNWNSKCGILVCLVYCTKSHWTAMVSVSLSGSIGLLNKESCWIHFMVSGTLLGASKCVPNFSDSYLIFLCLIELLIEQFYCIDYGRCIHTCLSFIELDQIDYSVPLFVVLLSYATSMSFIWFILTYLNYQTSLSCCLVSKWSNAIVEFSSL